MPAPSWVPVVDGAPIAVWLDFRNNQYWNGAVVGLTSQINDVNGIAIPITAGLGFGPFSAPLGSGLASAQTNTNIPPPTPAPSISDTLNTLNTLDAGGGYTMIAGCIINPQPGHAFLELGTPWQNPPTSNFNLIEFDTVDNLDGTCKLRIGIEQLTPSFFFNDSDTPYNNNSPVNIQWRLNEAGPNFKYSFNGNAARGPVTLGEKFNAEGAMQFLYLGNEANSVSGTVTEQLGVRPIGYMQYFAVLANSATFPLVNFPSAFLPTPPAPIIERLPFALLVPIPRNPGLWR